MSFPGSFWKCLSNSSCSGYLKNFFESFLVFTFIYVTIFEYLLSIEPDGKSFQILILPKYFWLGDFLHRSSLQPLFCLFRSQETFLFSHNDFESFFSPSSECIGLSSPSHIFWDCLNLLGSVSLLETHAMELHSRVTSSEMNLWKYSYRCSVLKKRKGRRERKRAAFHPEKGCSETLWDGEMEWVFPAVGLSSCMPHLVWAAHSVDVSLGGYSSNTNSVF